MAQKLRQVLSRLAEGQTPPPERLTVGAYLTQWLETCVRPSVRPRTSQRYTQLVRLHLAPALGRLPLQRLGPQDVQRFLLAKQESGLSARTVRFIHAVLRRALGQAEKWGLVPRNVARLVTPPKAERPTIRPFTVEEARRLLATVRWTVRRLEALYVLALTLGLRQGELLGLAWEDVDLDRGVLTIRHQLQWLDGRWALTEPKTRRSRRTLPLPPLVREALRAHRLRQKEERLRAGLDRDGPGLHHHGRHPAGRPEPGPPLPPAAPPGRPSPPALPRPPAHGGDAAALRGGGVDRCAGPSGSLPDRRHR